MVSTALGYDIEFDYNENKWIYSDTKESVTTPRECKHCGKLPTKDGHDFCIANLPNVKFACCGHGRNDEMSRPYVVFKDGREMEFNNKEELLKYFNLNK